MRPSTIWYTLKQGIKNIKRNFMFSIASIITMAACIFLFGIFFSIVNNVNTLAHKVEEDVPITVLFNEGTTQEQMDAVGELIRQRPEVSKIEFESGDEAYIKTLDNVREVNQSEQAAKTLGSINRIVSYVSVAVIVILLLIAVFLISNTISVGITVRKDEIGIMKYIGATDSFVRAPFLLEGMILGLIGAGIPLIILYFCYNNVVTYVYTKFSVLLGVVDFIPVGQIYQTLVPVALALGIGIGLVGSFITTRKHLKV